MNKRDYYEVLGVEKSADKAAIKKAYRNLAKKFHPDRNKESGAEDRFKEVQEAYDILSDDQKRSAYDQYGFAGTQGFGGYESSGFSDFAGMGDIFEQFFGGGGFDFTGARPRSRSRGQDIETTIKITFAEAVFGGEREIAYRRFVTCDECSGSGAEGGEVSTCSTCKGSGQVRQVQNTFFGQIQTAAVCPTCGGEGKVAKNSCKKCGGEGRKEERDTFNIKIPAGIPDQVSLKFRGRGQAGRKGGENGDLYVSIEVAAHDQLERRGDDIYLDWDIDVMTAVLGGEIEIPSVSGEITIKVPAGTQPEKVIKLTGKGGPKFRTPTQNGDQYVRFRVVLPNKLTREEREVWQRLQEMRSKKKKGWF